MGFNKEVQARFDVEKKSRYLGVANSWGPDEERDALLFRCEEAGHKTKDNAPPNHRSGLHTVMCEICGYHYQFDTSD